jgi:hypothetical protein
VSEDRFAQSVVCPACGAEINRPCERDRGCHPSRIRQAKRAAGIEVPKRKRRKPRKKGSGGWQPSGWGGTILSQEAARNARQKRQREDRRAKRLNGPVTTRIDPSIIRQRSANGEGERAA